MGLRCALLAVSDGPLHPGSVTFGSVDLDKTWHTLHFLLSGTSDGGTGPAQFLLGGAQLPEVDEEDAHAKLQAPAAVKAFSAVLEAVSDDELLARLAPERMNALDLYGWDWGEDSGFDRRFILQHLTPLRAFISQHAREGHAILVTIS